MIDLGPDQYFKSEKMTPKFLQLILPGGEDNW